MTELYSKDETRAAFALKKRLWWIFGAVSAVWLAGSLLLYFFRFAIDKESYTWMLVINIFAGIFYACFAVFFFSVKFRLTRKYCNMLKGFDVGLREEREGVFVAFDATVFNKDGVDCESILTQELYDKRKVPRERKILLDKTRPRPPFDPGDKLHYFTHANILVEYEVVGKSEILPMETE